MANLASPLDGFRYGEVQDNLSSTDDGSKNVEGGIIGKQYDSYGAKDWKKSGAVDQLYSDCGIYQNVSSEQGFMFSKYPKPEQHELSYSDFELLDNLKFDIASPPIQACQEEIAKLGEIPTGIQGAVQPINEKQFSLASLELLKNHGSGFKRLHGGRRIKPIKDTNTTFTNVETRKLSTQEIMRIAGEKFIRSSSRGVEYVSMLSNSFDLSFSGLSVEEIRDVELAEFLLAAAEKVGYQQYERAARLLNQCDCLSSKKENPVQRIVFYFAEALHEKIASETGRITSKQPRMKQPFDFEVAIMSSNPTTLAYHQELPFSKILQFTGVQAIVENVAEAKRIHIIDLRIRNGVQWTVLMQDLASRYECPIELLKMTAVGTKEKQLIEETGKRLTSFAQSMNLPFSYNIVMVSNMLELKEDLFEIDAEETVAIYASLLLRTMIAFPDHLENVLRVIRNINPSVMVVIEIEANHNSPVFVDRFIEALFFFSACFDCIEACMKPDKPHRMITEQLFFSDGIRSILAAEGEERKIRHVKLDVWRAFFVRYGMEEMELSMSSLFQARLMMKQFPYGSSCTIDMNGRSLIVGWKGTPITSISVWKFL